MKKKWIIEVVALVTLGISPLMAQESKSMKLDSDIIDKPKEVAKENYKGKLFDEGNFEKMPQFPGGEVELLKFIQSKIQYPNVNYQYEAIYGKVLLRFVVTKSGDISKVEILRSLDSWADKEAIRVIKLLPKFIPGEQNGKKVNVWYTIPVTFRFE